MKGLRSVIYLLCSMLFWLLPDPGQAALGDIVTLAGGGGASTSLNLPGGVTVDSAGNIYIADSNNYRVQKIYVATGTRTTVAGWNNGTKGYSGDNGAATSALLSGPAGIALDRAGNLYIADQGNNCIRKVDTYTGIITTVAGNGVAGYSGDNGAATAANLNLPGGVAVDSAGNIFIADSSNNRIRKVSINGYITTVAGNGIVGYFGDNGNAATASLNHPKSVAVDSLDNLYIADSNNQRIRKVSAGNEITTVAGNGTYGYSGDNGAAASASLSGPSGVAVDRAGNLYIADTHSNRIRKVTIGTGIITTVAGNGIAEYTGDNGSAILAGLSGPVGVTVDNAGTIYIADRVNNRIRKVVENIIPVVTASPNGGALTLAQTVILAADKPSTIYYTTDGTDPTISGTRQSFATTGQLTINTTSTLKFYAVDNDGIMSLVATQNYPIITVPGAPRFVSAIAGNAQATVYFTAPVSNGGSAVTSYTVTSSSGNLTATGNTSPITVTGLNNGTIYMFYVVATNLAGSGETWFSNSVTPVSPDNTPPTLVMSTLINGARTNNATLNISGTVTDLSGVVSLTINTASVAIGTGGSFSSVVTMQPGANTITTTAIDAFGNQTTDTRIITLDQSAPVLTVSTPADNSKTAQPLATVAGTISETSTVTVKVNSGSPQNASITGNSYSATVNLASGLNTITIKATDMAGNTSSAARTVTYDNTNPSLAITDPNQDVTTALSSITISGTVSDTITSTAVSIGFNGQTLTPPVTNGTFSQLLAFPNEATWPVVVTALDEVGNSVTATRNIIYAIPANGSCGASNNATLTVAPTSYLCNSGTASGVTGTGPWGWTCSGTNGGTTSTCSANIAIPAPTQFTVTPQTGSGFTIAPATPQTVNNNATTSFTVTPVSGYGIASVSGCGGSLSGSSYTTGTMTANCTVTVTAVARTATSGTTPTITDALKVLQAVVGITPLTATEQIRYDVAPLGSSGKPVGNGTIDAADIILILRRSIGIGSW